MADLYNRADIYDLIEDEGRRKVCQRHWEAIRSGRKIDSLLDVSIGTGNVTLPAAELSIRLAGSDLSESMLDGCRRKAEAANIPINLQCCDFREVSDYFAEKFDCVASTGNSLPHVSNKDVLLALEQMDSLVGEGGYLYFDTRNWDKILRDRNRFYLYNPFFDGDTRINLMQVWDYHGDEAMTFHVLYTFEKENRIFQKEKFEEYYFPVKKKLLLDKLREMGYQDIEVMNFPAFVQGTDLEETDWYCVIARKS